jgi:hypothetical protein
VELLWAAVIADVVAILLALVGGFRAHLAGYGLSALVAIGSVAAFPRVDAVRRRSRYYAPRRALRKVAATLALATLAVAVVHAWPIADRLAS